MKTEPEFDEFWDEASLGRERGGGKYGTLGHASPSARHASSALRRLSCEGKLRPMKVTHERRGSACMVKGG